MPFVRAGDNILRSEDIRRIAWTDRDHVLRLDITFTEESRLEPLELTGDQAGRARATLLALVDPRLADLTDRPTGPAREVTTGQFLRLPGLALAMAAMEGLRVDIVEDPDRGGRRVATLSPP